MHANIYDEGLALLPPPPSRFTQSEWYLNNRIRYRGTLDQQQLADKILAECDRGNQQICEITLSNKREVDYKIQQRITDIEFNRNEILRQRKEVCLEVDNLVTYAERLMDSMASLETQGSTICKKCIAFRENRVGIDLCVDDAERELYKEMDLIKGCQDLLRTTLEQANEQIRRLRSTLYVMDRDLEDKDNAVLLDKQNLVLDESSLNLSMYHGFTPLDSANISNEEWEHYTRENILCAAKEITSARSMRAYIEKLLAQVVEDLLEQFNAVNEAFRRKIEETKEAKTKLEVQHSEISRQANEITRKIVMLKKSLADKEGYMALAHTRMGNRAQRNGMELCRDLVETYLANEVSELRANCGTLQTYLTEASASLRYLLKTQIQIEEDINVKTNTLKIDEVDCMTLRQSMDYHAY